MYDIKIKLKNYEQTASISSQGNLTKKRTQGHLCSLIYDG